MTFHRRTFLKAAGVSLALPCLDAFALIRAFGAPAVKPSRRMVCICTPLGLHPPFFFPEKTGKDYEPTAYLEVLKDFRSEYTVVAGLSHAGMSPGFAHQASASFLTGVQGAGRPGFRNAISLDQFAAEKIGGNLEAAYAVAAKLLGPAIEPQPASDKVVVYVYRSRSAFEAVRSELGVPAFAAGFYGPTGMLSFSLEVPVVEELVAEMIHESTHAYLHQHVIRHGVALPRWLNEGFAMYMGNSEIRGGDLIPGSHRAFAALHAPGVVYHDRTRAKVDADQVRSAIKKGAALRVADLLSARPSDFYGEKVELYYPQAWLLVHFLIHGGDRWGEERFPKLMLYAAEGFPVDAAIRAVYGLDGPALETAYQSYVATF
jgi:hypothetical protein